MSSLEKLFNQLDTAGEVQSKKDKKNLLILKLSLFDHPFRTATRNDSNYDQTTYGVVCDRLTLEHQQLTHGDAATVAPNAFYAERGTKKYNGKRD